MTSSYLTEPIPGEKTMPKGIRFIIGNEAAERFSYYGMRAIFTLYMVNGLLFSRAKASEIYGSYTGNQQGPDLCLLC